MTPARQAWIASICMFACGAGVTQAEVVTDQEASRRQSQTILKAIQEAQTYAASIGLSGDWYNYCWLEMNRKAEHKTDGSIPFGVSYKNIEKGTLDVTLEILGMWMKNETILCLARVKGDLARAAEAAGRR